MKLYKKSFKGIALAAFSVLALSACSDWTDSESIKLKEPGIDEQSPELYAKYLKNLQEYKNSDHKIVYGWFDNSEKVPFSRGKTPLEIEKDLLKALPANYAKNANHWLVLFGRYICKAQRPDCAECPIAAYCHCPDKRI